MSGFSLVLLKGRRKHQELLAGGLVGRDHWGDRSTEEAIAGSAGRPCVRMGRNYCAISDPQLWARMDDIRWAKLSQEQCAMCLIYDSASTAFQLRVWERGLLVRHVQGSAAEGLELELGAPLAEEVNVVTRLASLRAEPAVRTHEPWRFPIERADEVLYGVSVRVLGARLDRLVESWTTPWIEYDQYEEGAEVAAQELAAPVGGGPELLGLLQAKGLVELSVGADPQRVGESLEPLLLTKDEPHAVAERVIDLLIEHPDVVEVFATEDSLAPLLAQW